MRSENFLLDRHTLNSFHPGALPEFAQKPASTEDPVAMANLLQVRLRMLGGAGKVRRESTEEF